MYSLIEVWHSSGKSQKEFCQEKGIAYQKFHYWFKKYKEEMNTTPGFSKVEINNRRVIEQGGVELQFPDGRKLIFHQGVEVVFLRSLLS